MKTKTIEKDGYLKITHEYEDGDDLNYPSAPVIVDCPGAREKSIIKKLMKGIDKEVFERFSTGKESDWLLMFWDGEIKIGGILDDPDNRIIFALPCSSKFDAFPDFRSRIKEGLDELFSD